MLVVVFDSEAHPDRAIDSKSSTVAKKILHRGRRAQSRFFESGNCNKEQFN